MDDLREMYDEWAFFRSTFDNAAMALVRIDLEITMEYANLAGEELRKKFFTRLTEEHRDAVDLVPDISERSSLLKREWLEKSPRRHNPYVGPPNLLQTYLLSQIHRTDEEKQTLQFIVKGTAAGMKNTE